MIFQIKGISCYGKSLQENGQEIDKSVISFIENVLFTTLTNVNFDAEEHVELLRKSQEIKENLRDMAGEIENHTAHASYNLPETKTEMLKGAPPAGIMYDKSLDPDIRSLRQLILYGSQTMISRIWKCCWNRRRGRESIFIPIVKCCPAMDMRD